MNSHSSSISSVQDENQQNKVDLSQHNIVFSDTLSRRSKTSTSSSGSKLAMLSEKVNSCLSRGVDDEVSAFKTSHVELKELADYCQRGEIRFGEIKTYSAQSLASVAYRINSASKLVLEVLSTQSKQFNELSHELNLIHQKVHHFEEKKGRHHIAQYTSEKRTVLMRRIAPPMIKERPCAYIRTAMDFTKYDNVGRGFFYEDIIDDVRDCYGPSLPLSLNGSIEGFQIIPRMVTNSDSPTLPRINYHSKLTNGSNDTYALPITTFHPNSYLNRTKPLQPKAHAIPTYYPIHNLSNSILNRMETPDIDMLRQGHTADSLYDYIQPMSRHTTNNSESTSMTSMSKDSLRQDEVSLPDLTQLPPPPEYLLTSSPLQDDLLSYEKMISQQETNSTIPSDYIERVTTLYKYASQRYDELSFEPGDVIYVVKKNEDGWYEGYLNGYRGLFPGNYAEVV